MMTRAAAQAAIAASVALCCLAAHPIAASELRAALAQAPFALSHDARGDQLVAFIGARDLLAPLPGSPVAARPERRLVAAVSSEAVEAFFFAPDEAGWAARTGLARSEVSSFLLYGRPPSVATSWRFTEPARAQPFMAFLKTRGFVEGADGAVSNGKPFALDLKTVDLADPFLGRLGRNSTLAMVGDGVLQSTDPRMIAAAREAPNTDPLAEPGIAAALAGVEKATDGRVPQATILLRGAAGSSGVVIMAEIDRPEGRIGLVVAIGNAACGPVEAASAQVSDAWRARRDLGGKTPLERTGAEPVVTIEQAGGSCAAIVTLLGSRGGLIPPYRYVMRAITRRDFPPLAVER